MSIMGDTKTEILEAVKLLLEIKNNESDELIMLYIEDMTEAVLSYCRLTVLPRQLVSFIPTLVARQLRINERGGVKSLTEGERRVEYSDGNYDFLSEYASRLKPFISRSVKLPSDLEREKNDESI